MKTVLRVLPLLLLALFGAELHAGNLRVNLAPSPAVNAGAQWRVDGGNWRNSGATVNNLSNATHQVEFRAVSGWLAPQPLAVTIVAGTTTLTGTYVRPASLRINLTPTSGRWRVDGGVWRTGGTTVSGLAPGNHAVDYEAQPGYATPASETVALVSDQTTTLARTYVQLAQVTVTLTPAAAQWRIDGGAWRASGATAANLMPGAHTIDYAPVAGYITPASDAITLTAGQSLPLAKAYVQLGQLTVTLSPTSGQWRANGGAWQASGATLANLPAGSYTVEYSTLAAPSWGTPPAETVALAAGQSLAMTRSYTQLGQVFITLVPSTGTWRLNGGAWQASGTSLWVAPGSYTVDYSTLANYDSPPADTFADGFIATRHYVSQLPTLRVDLTPAAGQWRVDGGAWQASGARVADLAVGDHTVEYLDIGGDRRPLASETVSLTLRENRTLTRSYPLKPASLTVTLTPATAQWRLLGATAATWRQSGETVGGLPPGDYTIEYSAVPNYTAPAAESLTLAADQSLSLARSYSTIPAQIAVTLQPATAQWRVDGGAWQASGAALGGLVAGSHVLEFSPTAGFAPPLTQIITLNPGESINYGFLYTPQAPGQLTVKLTPATGQWRVDGGAWQISGATVGGLSTGSHAVEFSTVPGYVTPFSTTVDIGATEIAHLTRTYDRGFAGVQVTLNPSQGRYRVDGWMWSNSGSSTWSDAGVAHLFEYEPIAGLPTPPAEYIKVDVAGQSTSITRSYQAAATATVSVGLNLVQGQWRIYSGATPSGAWKTGSATVAGLAAGTYAIEYAPVPGYGSPTAETLTLAAGQGVLLHRAYTSFPGQVSATLSPAEGQWRISPAGGPTSNAWRPSGAAVPDLPPGSYVIDYAPLAGYETPSSETIELSSGEAYALTKSYRHVHDLRISLSPPTAQWRVDGGAWQASGAGVWGLTAGSHTIEYASVPGYLTPPAETVTFTPGQPIELFRFYTQLGSLTVYVNAVGARWRVDGGAWQPGGATVVGLAGGVPHTVDYEAAAGYVAPASETITLYNGESRTLYAFYSSLSSVTAHLNAPGGRWRVDGGEWQLSGATVSNLAYNVPHTIDYQAVAGYVAPPPETVTLYSGESRTVYAFYPSLSSVTVYLNAPGGRWRIDGGEWQLSGATVANLAYNVPHTIDYQATIGYVAPPSETVSLYSGETRTAYGYYSLLSALTVNFNAPGGRWRVDGGAWQLSGATVPNLAYNVPHIVDYQAIEGYVAPAAESVSMYSGETRTLYAYYTPLASVTVSTSAPGGEWRVDGGAWQPSGATVGNLAYNAPHRLEFRPVRNYVTPPAQTFTAFAGETKSLTGYYDFLGAHAIRFFVHPDLAGTLAPAEVQRRLAQYAAHLMQVLHRETNRQFTYQEGNVTIAAADPFSGSYGSYAPDGGFELWIYATPTDDPVAGSHGGSVGIDASGAGGVRELRWDQIHDPAALADGSPALAQYWRQLHLITRQVERLFGAGQDGYDSLGGLKDASGVAPLLPDVVAPDSATPDAFWTARFDYWTDPLTANAHGNPRLGSPTSLQALLDVTSFAPVSRAIINGRYRNPSVLPMTLPATNAIAVRVVNAQTGALIPGATLRVWNRAAPTPPHATFEEAVTAGSAPGEFAFAWTGDGAPFAPTANAKLLKAFAPGYAPVAQWVTVFDAQLARLTGESYTWTITLALNPQ